MSVNASGSFLPTTANMPVGKSKAKGLFAAPIRGLEGLHGTVQHNFGIAIDHKMHQLGQTQHNEEFDSLLAKTPAGKKVTYTTRYGTTTGYGTGGNSSNLNQTQFKDPGAPLPAGQGRVFAGNPMPAPPAKKRVLSGSQAPVRVGQQVRPGGNQPPRFAQPIPVNAVQRPMLALPPGMQLAPGATRTNGMSSVAFGPQTEPRTFAVSNARGEAKPRVREVKKAEKTTPTEEASPRTKLLTPYEKVGSKSPGKPGKAVVPETKPAPKKASTRKPAAKKATPRGKK